MNTSPAFARLASVRHRLKSWRSATYVLGGVLMCDIAARVSSVRPDGQMLGKWFDRGDAGLILRLYDRLVGLGVSRGTGAALGFMPYLSARLFTWIARWTFPTLDSRWSHDAGRTERTRWTRGL